mgnify:FL=1
MDSRERPSSVMKSKQDGVNLSEGSENRYQVHRCTVDINSDTISDTIDISMNFGCTDIRHSNDQLIWWNHPSAGTDIATTDTRGPDEYDGFNSNKQKTRILLNK